MYVTIYSKPDCTYCTAAKNLLRNSKVAFEEKRLNIDFTREMLLEMFPQARTYPQVIVDGMNIGGFHQLKQLLESQNSNRILLNEGI